MEGLDHVPGESCARIVYVTLPEAGRGGKCGQGSLFNILHYQVGHNHRHRRPHCGTMYLPVHLPSEGQVGCVKAHGQEIHDVINVEVSPVLEGGIILQSAAGYLDSQPRWDTGEEGYHIKG